MEKPPHIYVVGAGLIGLSTADSLVARGGKVTVLDKRSGPGQGASFSNSGMIHPSQAAPWLEGDYIAEIQAVRELAIRSCDRLKSRMESLGLSDAGRRPGAMQLFDSLYIGEQVRKAYDEMGVTCEDVTGADYTYGRYALLFPQDRSGNAYAYCQALEADLRKAGVIFKYGIGSTNLDRLLSGSDPVIISAGIGSVAIAKKAGLTLPVYAERGHAVNFAKPDMSLPDVPIMHHASRSALTVFDDHVRLSGTVGEDDPHALIDIWEEIIPDIMRELGEPLNMWSEDRPMSMLGHPIICQAKDNTWIHTGHGHMGWTLCAGSGELMADMVLGGHKDERFSLIS